MVDILMMAETRISYLEICSDFLMNFSALVGCI